MCLSRSGSIFFFFFFSSRRRHTRWTGDRSSDVCSSDLVVSHDGRYLAENYDAVTAVQTSTVYGSAGEKLKDFDGAVAAFSWNATSVVLTARSGAKPPALATFEGQILWTPTAKPGIYAWAGLAEPGGDRLAIAIADPATAYASSTYKGWPAVDLYVVNPDGTVVQALKSV